MKTHAYNQLYLSKASRTVGNMLHDAVCEHGMEGADFLNRFVQSGVAEQFENGNPKYIAGKSGLELFLEIIEKTSGQQCNSNLIESYSRSDVYWVGWIIVHYQWYSDYTFANILKTIPYSELLSLYGTLHEADIQKSYDVLDAHFANNESKLKVARKRCGLTQNALAKESGVSLNTIRAYEHKSKDLGKASVEIATRLARALKCDISELLN